VFSTRRTEGARLITILIHLANPDPELLNLGKDYPQGISYFRTRLHRAFMSKAHLRDENEIRAGIERAEFVRKGETSPPMLLHESLSWHVKSYADSIELTSYSLQKSKLCKCCMLPHLSSCFSSRKAHHIWRLDYGVTVEEDCIRTMGLPVTLLQRTLTRRGLSKPSSSR
jgi:hypothetical protein